MMVRVLYDYAPAFPGDLPPAEGDVLHSMTGRAIYLIHGARKVKSAKYPHRWSYTCERIDRPGLGVSRPGPEARHFDLWWHRKTKRRHLSVVR